MKYKVGTRESKLALIQTEIVCKALVKQNPRLSLDQFELVKIKTTGDKSLDKNLIDIGGKNLFIKEIEEALLDKQIDFAVHSLKDMTANLDTRLKIAAYLEREDPRDAFISLKYKSLEEMPIGKIIGTSSIRRKELSLHYNPHLEITSFRGNDLTRLQKLEQNQVDATFLAVAGLKRLGISPHSYIPLDTNYFLPAISQGVIGVECRSDDDKIFNLLRSINHTETEICQIAERSFLEYMDADCSVPIAAFAKLNDNQITMDALIVDQAHKVHQCMVKGENSQKLGIMAGKLLIDKLK